MKQGLKRILVLGMLATPAVLMASTPGDSVGVKVKDGKAYVLYKLAKGDNLARISKEYGVSVANLEEINSIQATNIQAGQVIMVPSRNPNAGLSLKSVSAAPSTPKPAVVAAKPTEVAKPTPQNPKPVTGGKQHVVEKGETLYAVSRKYNVSVAQIKEWNQLTADGLKEGQKLWVSNGTTKPAEVKPVVTNEKPAEVKPVVTQEKPVVTNEKPVEVKPVVTNEKPVEVKKPVEVTKPAEVVAGNGGGNEGGTQPKIKAGGGVHVVKPGETLFGIARTYGMDVSELRKINRLEDATIKEGQALRVKADSQENPNQGTGLADALSQVQDSTPKMEAFPDLKVLTAPTTTNVPPAAIVTMYKDKSTGKNFKRVEESGRVGKIEDFSTDQTRFYAFHRYLPVGSYIRVDYPAKGQSILVEVINKLPENDPNAVRLSAKCLEYLMIREAGAEVRLRYVIPFAE